MHQASQLAPAASFDRADPETQAKLLTRKDAEKIMRHVTSLGNQRASSEITVTSVWQQTFTWGRNRITGVGDIRRRLLMLTRDHPGFIGCRSAVNQFDDSTLDAMIAVTDMRATMDRNHDRMNLIAPFMVEVPDLPSEDAPIWSDATAAVTAQRRAELATMLSTQARDRDLLSAGSVEVRIASRAELDPVYGLQFCEYTHAFVSATVRNPKGTGSGWAGGSSFDWKRIDPAAVASRALDKCLASIDPVRIEPGRYTVILEPQAVENLLRMMLGAFNRGEPEGEGRGPFFERTDHETQLYLSKIGTKIVDERVTIFHNPTSPGTGVLPMKGLVPVTWINNGVLTSLADGVTSSSRIPSLSTRNENIATISRFAYEMKGGPTSIEEMIQTTKRGLLVTRFWDAVVVHESSLLMTGITRDGLWLVENGKISKAVKNLRFVESPLFMLNQIDQIGPAVPIFVPPISGPGWKAEVLDLYVGPVSAMVPPIKAHDFNFLALVDAV